MKKIIVWTLVLALTWALGAGALADGSLDAIKEKGKLILGLDVGFPPMGFLDEDSDEIVGFDIDLAREVCARLGVELELKPIDWDAKFLELDSGNIDCVWNGMSYTDERAEIAALSMNYMYNAMVLLVKDPAYQTKEDLAGKVVAVQAGSYAEELLKDDENYAEYLGSLKEVLSYPTYLLAIMDLQNGNADAVFIDLVVADYITTSLGDDSLFTMGNMEDDVFCIGFRKDDVALRDAVNETLMAMAADGAMEEICVKWFGSNVSLIPAE